MMRRRFMNNSNSIPLSFEALEDGLSISFENEILYCINGGVWETLLKGENTEEVNKGSVISFRHAKSFFSDGSIGYFSINKKCNIYGACSSIIPKVFGEKFMSSNLFNNLFRNCDAIVDASKLELPTTLAESCYECMFYGCSSLVNAPALPATTLAKSCYECMFYGCSSLVNAPALPATTLAEYCYECMFYGCTKLNYIKMLAVNISVYWCLYDWVSGVASIGTFVKNKDAAWNTTPGALGDRGVPAGWTVVNDGEESGEGGLTTFYLNDENELYKMKASPGMTWEDWINSTYVPTEGDLRNFRLYSMGSYYTIMLYHELASQDMSVYEDASFHQNVSSHNQIENGKTYYLH